MEAFSCRLADEPDRLKEEAAARVREKLEQAETLRRHGRAAADNPAARVYCRRGGVRLSYSSWPPCVRCG